MGWCDQGCRPTIPEECFAFALDEAVVFQPLNRPMHGVSGFTGLFCDGGSGRKDAGERAFDVDLLNDAKDYPQKTIGKSPEGGSMRQCSARSSDDVGEIGRGECFHRSLQEGHDFLDGAGGATYYQSVVWIFSDWRREKSKFLHSTRLRVQKPRQLALSGFFIAFARSWRRPPKIGAPETPNPARWRGSFDPGHVGELVATAPVAAAPVYTYEPTGKRPST